MISIAIFAQKSKLKIQNDSLELPINYKIKISAKIKDEKLYDFKLLKKQKVKRPTDMIKILDNEINKKIISKEIEFKFCYANFMGSRLVVLTTVHHLKNPIIYKAKIKIKGKKNYIETSIVTKYPNVFSVEQWQNEIESIILYDFKTIKE